VADAVTKAIVAHSLPVGVSLDVLGSYVRLTHVRNVGASFGLFPGNTYPLIALSSLAVLIVLALALRGKHNAHALVLLGLILGGALGNLYDRVRLGEVIDFIDVGFGPHRWPVFNVADMAVTVGVFALLAHYLRRGGSAEPPRQCDGSADEPSEGAEVLGPSGG
jgi:signal peptidase II